MADIKLTSRMAQALTEAQMDNDGKLAVGWPVPGSGERGTWWGYNTLGALQSRGLINDKHQLTEAGEVWFNENIDR